MELISTHMCKEGDCGYHGNLFGGLMLAWLDESAVAYACQLSDTPRMVTVAMDKVEFLKPVRPGQVMGPEKFIDDFTKYTYLHIKIISKLTVIVVEFRDGTGTFIT